MQTAKTAVTAAAGASSAAQQPLEVPADLIDLALRLADAAAEVTTKYFRQGFLSNPVLCWSKAKCTLCQEIQAWLNPVDLTTGPH